MYTWEGMHKMTFGEIMEAFHNGELEGCYWLYPDNTEGAIDTRGLTVEDIIERLEQGIEVGFENEE